MKRGTAAALAGTALALAAHAIWRATGPEGGRLLHGLADESLLLPLAMDAADPAAFAADSWLGECRAVFSPVYSRIVAAALPLFADPVDALAALALPFHAAFLAGCFAVADRVAGRPAAWTATIASATIPFVSAYAWGAEGGWPLVAAAALPRDLVFAALPWVWLLRERFAGGGVAPRAVPALLLGLLANVHPLTAVHAFGAFVLLDAWDAIAARGAVRGATGAPTGVRAVAASAAASVVAGVVAFTIGAVPYLVQYAQFPATPGAAAPEVLAWRVAGIGVDTLAGWTRRMEPALWCLAADALLHAGRDDAAVRPLRRLAWIAAVLAAFGPVAQMVIPGIQTARLVRVAEWAVVLTAAARLTGPVPPVRGAASLVCLAFAAASPALARPVTGAPRGGLEWVARRVEVRTGLASPAPAGSPAPERDRPEEPSTDPRLAAAFRAVCADAARLSAPGDRFLVPPETFGSFRVYAGRPVSVTLKEGGAMLSFLGGKGALWFEDYCGEVRVRAQGEPADWAALAGRKGARWAVLDGSARLPEDWKAAAAQGPYRIFRTSVR